MSINVGQIERVIPSLKKYPSVDDMHDLVNSLREDKRFSIDIVGYSESGSPIHHVKFGEGKVKALYVGFPHADEPVGGLTVINLISLLRDNNKELTGQDVEWNIIPCIDPDGARLNESWSQKEYSVKSFMKGFHKQRAVDQVDGRFPLNYKKLKFDNISKEAEALKLVIDKVRPDFFHSLHNAIAGGAFFFISKNISENYYGMMRSVLGDSGIPGQVKTAFGAVVTTYSEAVFDLLGTREIYDNIEKSIDNPEEFIARGATSWEYLAQVNPGAISFVAEVPYLAFDGIGSEELTDSNLRYLTLKTDVEAKFLKSLILDEWELVEGDLNTDSPFYRKISPQISHAKDSLHESLPEMPLYTARSILFNKGLNRLATKEEVFYTRFRMPFGFLCNNYEFIRLLKDSEQTERIKASIDKLAPIFEEALNTLMLEVKEIGDIRVLDINDLVKIQFGCGLHVLNSLLED